MLLTAGAVEKSRLSSDDPMLALAVYTRNQCLVKLLFPKTADINAANTKGRTALHFAAELGDFVTISYLLTCPRINLLTLPIVLELLRYIWLALMATNCAVSSW